MVAIKTIMDLCHACFVVLLFSLLVNSKLQTSKLLLAAKLHMRCLYTPRPEPHVCSKFLNQGHPKLLPQKLRENHCATCSRGKDDTMHLVYCKPCPLFALRVLAAWRSRWTEQKAADMS